VASYKVEIKKSALKDVEKLDKSVIPQIFRVVVVFGIGHRRDIYRDL